MKKIKTIVFDIDGTLFKTDTYLVCSINKALHKLNLPLLNEKKIISNIGLPSKEYYETLFPDYDQNTINRIKQEKKNNCYNTIKEKGELYNGVTKVLEILHENLYTLCICSNGRKEYIDFILDFYQIRKYFRVIKTYIDNKNKTIMIKEIRKELGINKLIFVGDRIIDFKAASNNKCYSIGMTYGYGKHEVSYSNCKADDTEELLSKIEKLSHHKIHV